MREVVGAETFGNCLHQCHLIPRMFEGAVCDERHIGGCCIRLRQVIDHRVIETLRCRSRFFQLGVYRAKLFIKIDGHGHAESLLSMLQTHPAFEHFRKHAVSHPRAVDGEGPRVSDFGQFRFCGHITGHIGNRHFHMVASGCFADVDAVVAVG